MRRASGPRAKFSAERAGAQFLPPESIPRELNYVVLTGTLAGNPRAHRGPTGEPVTLLRVEFPVVNPTQPRTPWTHASYEVEVPENLGHRLYELRDGTPVLVSGQLSERLMIEDGCAERRGVILATLVKPGLPVKQPEASR